MPVLEGEQATARDLAIQLLEELSEEDLKCSECGIRNASWWNYHLPDRSCRSPFCNRCRVVTEIYFKWCLISRYFLHCNICNKTNIPLDEVRWEKMT